MTTYRASIEKTEVQGLPKEEYQGPVEVYFADQLPESVTEHLFRQRVVGFDTETRPVFIKGKSSRVSLLQLACEDICYLIRLHKRPFPDSLRDFFNRPDIVKVGLSSRDDFAQLRKICPTLDPQNVIELQSYVRRVGIEDLSLQKIYAIMFGKKISKTQQLSNWEAETLNPAQIQYAALDAVATRRILLECGFTPSDRG